MVDFKKLSTRAKDLVEQRGGSEGLKKDAAELREIAKGKGSFSDKAKAAAEALKQTGANEPAQPAAAAAPAPDSAPKPDPQAPSSGSAGEAEPKKAEARKPAAEARATEGDPSA